MQAKIARLLSTCVAFLTMLTIGNAAEQSAPIPPEIENEQILDINKEPVHATLMPYATMEQALAANRLASPYCKLLNGNWKFHWVNHPAKRPVDFWQARFRCFHMERNSGSFELADSRIWHAIL